jgi:hypothetical protein
MPQRNSADRWRLVPQRVAVLLLIRIVDELFEDAPHPNQRVPNGCVFGKQLLVQHHVKQHLVQLRQRPGQHQRLRLLQQAQVVNQTLYV